MFSKMREALGIEKRVDILDHIDSLPTPSEQKQAHQKIQTVEREAMSQMVPQPGLVELMSYLDSRGIKKAICTRNFESPVQHLLTSFLGEFDFEPLITRSFKPPKPSPAGVLHIARKWGFGTEDGELAEDMIMVGDSLDDMLAGRAAGTTTVLLKNAVNTYLVDHESTDAVIER
jgi:HAD superfamily hydrolase (TIGR01549 family)